MDLNLFRFDICPTIVHGKFESNIFQTSEIKMIFQENNSIKILMQRRADNYFN